MCAQCFCDFRRQVIVLNNCFTKGGKVIRSKVEPYFVNLAEFPNVHFWLLPQKIRGLAAVPVLRIFSSAM